eukprot:10458-Heterococcus_DN1.PRE.2
MCYNALIDTQRPYLSGVTQLPQLPTLLLFGAHIDTNSDGSMLLFDHWLLAEVNSISTHNGSKHKRSKHSTTDTTGTADSDTQERATASITDIVAQACDLRLRLQQLLDCSLTKANKAVGFKSIMNSNSSSKRRYDRQQQQSQQVGNAVINENTVIPRVLRDIQAKYTAAIHDTHTTTTDGNVSDVSVSSRSSLDEEDTKSTTLAHDMAEFMRLHIKCSVRKVMVYEVEARLRAAKAPTATAATTAKPTTASTDTTDTTDTSDKCNSASNDDLLKLLQQAVTGSIRAGRLSSLKLQSYKHGVQIAPYIRWNSLNDISDADTTKYIKAAAGILDSSSSIHKAALYACPICTREMHVDQTQLEMHRAVCKPHKTAADAISTHNTTNNSRRIGSKKKMIGTPII